MSKECLVEKEENRSLLWTSYFYKEHVVGFGDD